MSKKILKVAVLVILAIIAFKFLTSGLFGWMIVGFVLPQVVRFVGKKGYLNNIITGLYDNAYRYTLVVVVIIAILRLIFAHGALVCLIGELLGLGLSYVFFENPVKK